MASARDLLSRPDSPSFLENLYAGELSWGLLAPFPDQPADDRAAGDRAVAEIARFLTEWIDPEAVDETGTLPAGFVDELKKRGLLKLGVPEQSGGWGLSPRNIFRVVTEAASRSVAVALIIAIDNAIGLSGYLPHLPPGALRDFVQDRVECGAVSCTADTEPEGAANTERRTVAEPVENGEAFLITGSKVFVGNAPIADVVIVSATVTEEGTAHRRLFFVDADTPGLRVHAGHGFMGLRGFPNGALTFDHVRVGRERMLVEEGEEGYGGRMPRAANLATILGRNYLIAAPSLALARLGTAWAQDFASRRSVDGRALDQYDEVQRMLAATAADCFAIDTVTTWTMEQPDPDGPVNTAFEQLAVKNVSSLAAWRALDRAMSLLGAEGFESSPSKARRCAVPVPLERAVRDARGLRISGGVDFALDYWAGRLILPTYYPEPRTAAGLDDSEDLSGLPTDCLSERNVGHARYATRQAKDLAGFMMRLRASYPEASHLLAEERIVISVNGVVNEILTMAAVLARAAKLAETGHSWPQGLADMYCSEARRRIADLWAAAEAAVSGDEPDHAAICADLTEDGRAAGIFQHTGVPAHLACGEGDAR
ncbi:acyl-CoA dehydrogenase family protein [Streptomyces sp. NRRL S-646]|uniref:acyl-CoA dehydrogenase family protein n=1 Tax=Streptomyces sp. NRRL S-646 TaxID=1463917 RepID=UPI00069152D7|nr:acyl-CoA dehydrogenase family protein [Streptomyces sp. NRRL S-646]